VRPDWTRVWHITAFLIVLAVLAVASSVLRANPTSAMLALISFGLVYLVAAGLIRRPYLGVLGLLLSILGLFVCGCHTRTDIHIYPIIVVLLVSLFVWLVNKTTWEKSKLISLFARWTLYIVSVGVSAYIIIEREAFTTNFPVVGVLSPLLLAGVYYFMDIRLGRSIFLWPFSFLLGTSLFVLLYSIPALSPYYYGLIFAATGGYLLARGAARSGLGRRHAILSTHTIGVSLILIGLFYAVPHFVAVILLLAVSGVGFWGTNRIHRRARMEARPGILGIVEGAIPTALTLSLNVTALVLFVLLAWKGFFIGWPAFVAASVMGLVYVAISVDRFWRSPKRFTKRSYIGLATVFLAISFLQLVKFGIATEQEHYLLYASLAAFAVLTIFGILLLRKRPNYVGFALLDAGNLVPAVALLALMVRGVQPGISAAIVGASILVLSAVTLPALKTSGHLASIGVGVVYLVAGLSGVHLNVTPLMGYLFMFVSIALGILGISRDKDMSLLIGWHAATVFSILASRAYPGELATCLALASISYVWNSFRTQNIWYKIALTVIGAVSGLVSIVYIAIFGLGVYSIIVLFLIGAGLLIVSSVRRIRVTVPVAGLVLVAGYFLLLHQLFSLWSHLLWALPLLAVFYAVSVRKTERAEFFSSLKWNSLVFLLIVSAFLLSQSGLPQSILIAFLYFVFFVAFLMIRWMSKEFLYTVLSFAALALAAFFVIRSATPTRPELGFLLFAPTAPFLVAIGYIVQKKRLIQDARSVYGVAALCALSIGIAAISGNQGQVAYGVLAISTLTYLILLSLWRLEIFPYLITVNLGMIAFTYARANIDQFATQLLGIFLAIVAGVGLLVIHPDIKRIMRYSKPGSFLMIKSWRGAVLLSLPAMLIVLLIFFGLFAKLLDVPGFCVTCHYMKPYYDSWRVSTHSNVACVQCHYEPGLTPRLRGKVDGLLQMAKYVTRTYEPKPKAGISDKACLRSGCHETELIKGPILFNETISFDHHEHLTRLRRGKQLRCTSCHSQIVQGRHLTVTETVCFLCHFKDRGTMSVATGTCQSCHGEPTETVRYAGLDFDHVAFLEARQDINCMNCHVGVTSGEGEVAAERCLSCHSRTEEDLSDAEYLHKIHITEKKVECLECHSDIKHGKKVMAEALARGCRECHGAAQHVWETQIYAGTGGKGLPPSPDPMFRVGVHCSGCHKGTQTGKTGLQKAIKQACISCHDVAYGRMMAEWQESTRQALSGTRLALDKAKRLAKSSSHSDSYAVAESLITDAEFNVSLVEKDGSEGVHNISYTLDLLDVSENLAADAVSLIKTGKVAARSMAEKKPECGKRCHSGIEDVTVTVAGKSFPHGPHIDADLGCISCHGSEEHGKTRSNARKCLACHHGKDTKVKCDYCHGDIDSRTVKHGDRDFSHSKHVELTQFGCGECHLASETGAMKTREEICSQCHEE